MEGKITFPRNSVGQLKQLILSAVLVKQTCRESAVCIIES